MTNISRAFDSLSLKTLFYFILAIIVFIWFFLQLYTPFHDIPVLNIFFTGIYAYQTPIMVIQEYLPTVMLVSSLAGICYLYYNLRKWN